MKGNSVSSAVNKYNLKKRMNHESPKGKKGETLKVKRFGFKTSGMKLRDCIFLSSISSKKSSDSTRKRKKFSTKEGSTNADKKKSYNSGIIQGSSRKLLQAFDLAGLLQNENLEGSKLIKYERSSINQQTMENVDIDKMDYDDVDKEDYDDFDKGDLKDDRIVEKIELQVQIEKVNEDNSKKEKMKKKKNSNKVVCVSDEWLSIRTRASPKVLYHLLKSLTSAQKKDVIDMGFGSLLGMAVEEIPAKIAHYAVDNFDPDEMKLKLKHFDILITPEVIHEILGVPLGGKDLQGFHKLKEGPGSISRRWYDQFMTRSPTPKKVADITIETKVNGILFKLNFLVLFANIMGLGGMGGQCRPQQIIRYIHEGIKIEDINWCKYVFDCLKISKTGWARADDNSYFSGPLIVLTLIYLHATKCDSVCVTHEIPAIRFWSTELIKKRESFEILENGGFGNLDINEDNYTDDDSSKIKKQFEYTMEKLDQKVELMESLIYELEFEFSSMMTDKSNNMRLREIKSKFERIIRSVDLFGDDMEEDVHVYETEKENDDGIYEIGQCSKVREDEENDDGLLKQNYVSVNYEIGQCSKVREDEENLGLNDDGFNDDGFNDVSRNFEIGQCSNVEEEFEELDQMDEDKVNDEKQMDHDMVKTKGFQIFEVSEIESYVESEGIDCMKILEAETDKLFHENKLDVPETGSGAEVFQVSEFKIKKGINLGEKLEVEIDKVSYESELEASAQEGQKDRKDMKVTFCPNVDVLFFNNHEILDDDNKETVVKDFEELLDKGLCRPVNVSQTDDDDSSFPKHRLDVPPSFDLGIDFGDDLVEEDIKPLVKEVTSRHNSRREVNVGNQLRSPFKIRRSYPNDAISIIDDRAADTLFMMHKESDPFDVLYESSWSSSKTILIRLTLETLAPGLRIESEVIEAWSDVLNYMERYKSADSPSRFFFKPSVTKHLRSNYMLYEDKLKRFKDGIKSSDYEKRRIASLGNFNLVFFPICCFDHFFLICFNFKKGSVLVIDNSSVDDENDDRYLGLPQIMIKMFNKYISEVSFGKVVPFKNVTPERLKMKWRTKDNVFDDGVFLMSHMDTYFGENLTKWDYGLAKESKEQNKQLNLLRSKFAARILLSESNLCKDFFLEQVAKLGTIEKSKRKELIQIAVEKREERYILED